jgi:hypothetical protein
LEKELLLDGKSIRKGKDRIKKKIGLTVMRPRGFLEKTEIE